ncbi:MAG: HD-GYP domain-containing protein [Actinomycetota bacterium]|nr:HD-GYP domain-containing protein [Actinomycetota bacterium]
MRPTSAPLALCAAGTALPLLALLAAGRLGAHHLTSELHFAAVGGSALVATGASIALTAVAVRRRDARTVIVGTAFSVMAALLLLHGLASPGVLVGTNGLVSLTGGATLPVGALLLVVSTLPGLGGGRRIRFLVALQAALLAALAALGAIGFLFPAAVPDVPEPRSPASLALLGAGLLLYGYLALRAVATVLLTQRTGDALVVVGLGFLAAALAGALALDYTQLGWWLGHGFEIGGLALVGAAVATDLHRTRQSRPLTGGVGACDLVASEEAFLGARVRALTLRLAKKDGSTEEHTRRVARLAVQVGEELGLPPQRLRSLATGGLLHDIGKLAVPDAILKNPGPLADDELALVRRHPEWGHELLGRLGDFSASVRRLVLDHHERLDGTGYPRGLHEAQLDLETRILSVCDVYDALVSTRVYRDAWTHEAAIAFLREHASVLFDGRCVAALERVLARERGDALDVAV